MTLDLKYVKEHIESVDGYKLLSGEYIRAHSKLEILHSCGNIFWMSWDTFNHHHRCPKCSQLFRGFTQKLSFDFIRDSINSVKDYELISKSYINSKSLLEIKHSCGSIYKVSWNSWNLGSRCKPCSYVERNDQKRHSFNFVKKSFDSESYQLNSNEYINSNKLLDVTCPLGHEWKVCFSSWQQGTRCRYCEDISKRGVNSPHWNPNLTDEERENKRNSVERTKWLKAVYERDDHTCQKCLVRSGELVGHHIMPYALFPKLRWDVDNGVTLCKGCHKYYHSIYGNGLDCNHETIGDHLYLNVYRNL